LVLDFFLRGVILRLLTLSDLPVNRVEPQCQLPLLRLELQHLLLQLSFLFIHREGQPNITSCLAQLGQVSQQAQRICDDPLLSVLLFGLWRHIPLAKIHGLG
jgi:hypothetical protein